MLQLGEGGAAIERRQGGRSAGGTAQAGTAGFRAGGAFEAGAARHTRPATAAARWTGAARMRLHQRRAWRHEFSGDLASKLAVRPAMSPSEMRGGWHRDDDLATVGMVAAEARRVQRRRRRRSSASRIRVRTLPDGGLPGAGELRISGVPGYSGRGRSRRCAQRERGRGGAGRSSRRLLSRRSGGRCQQAARRGCRRWRRAQAPAAAVADVAVDRGRLPLGRGADEELRRWYGGRLTAGDALAPSRAGATARSGRRVEGGARAAGEGAGVPAFAPLPNWRQAERAADRLRRRSWWRSRA